MPEQHISYSDLFARVANDLWPAQSAPSAPAAQPAKQPEAAPEETLRHFDRLWLAVDETVEWTEALVHATCPDGMTDAQTWAFLHALAPRVLAGEPDAYRAAVDRLKPMDDLRPYVQDAQLTVADADRLMVVFEASPVYLDKEQAEQRRYFAGLSLRFARDLLALLPAESVAVTACEGGQPRLQVNFTRGFLRALRFGNIDPVQTVLDAGGVFSPAGEM